MRSLFKLLSRSLPVRTWHVFDADAPAGRVAASGGFVPARSKREAKARARECWPGIDPVVSLVTPRMVAEVYAEARDAALAPHGGA